MQLSYCGTPFHGWQIQPNAVSVQECLNTAASTMLGTNIHIIGAGRTDTGVHAREMWAHFDYPGELPASFTHRLNRMIGRDIAVRGVLKVAEDAHARFDALSRTYEYHFTFVKDPFLKDRAWYISPSPDREKMERAASELPDFEDFTSFSRSKTQTHTNLCTISRVEWHSVPEGLVFEIESNRFLRNMVRAIVGTLVEIGQGKRRVEDFRSLIAAKDRTLAGESAPACGLYLTRVRYPQSLIHGE